MNENNELVIGPDDSTNHIEVDNNKNDEFLKPSVDLLQWKDMPKHLQFNPYVITGYRPLTNVRGCVSSLFYYHNETVNIITHGLNFRNLSSLFVTMGSADQYLYDPNLINALDFRKSPAKLKPYITATDPGEPWMKVRPLKESDYDKGFLQLLSQLTAVGNISRFDFLKKFAQMKARGDYYVTVIEDTRKQLIIGAATLVIEHKFIHDCGLKGRLEDVVVNDTYRGKQLGKLITVTVTLLAQQLGCYKMSLECKDKLIQFYASLGDIHEMGSLLSLLFLVQLATGGLCICSSIYRLIFSFSENLVEFMINPVILSYNFFEIFMVMYFGNEIKSSSDRFAYCLFESNWIEQPESIKKRMIIFAEILQRPHVLVVGKLYSLTLQTFSRILNSAYSMFNFLVQYF